MNIFLQKKGLIVITAVLLAFLLVIPLVMLFSKKSIPSTSSSPSPEISQVPQGSSGTQGSGQQNGTENGQQVPTTSQNQQIQPGVSTTPQQSTSSDYAAEAQAEKNRAQQQSQIQQDYPWIDNFPITTQNYFVYFDTNTKHFIAKIYQSDNPSLDVNAVKNDLLQTLKSLDINTNSYTIDWIIQ